jgi:hypothetical protein
MIGRLVFIVAIFLLGFIAFRYFRTQILLREQQEEEANNVSSDKQGASIEELKPCSFCGVHMPEDEMLIKDKHRFCSYQHMLEFDKKNN